MLKVCLAKVDGLIPFSGIEYKTPRVNGFLIKYLPHGNLANIRDLTKQPKHVARVLHS
jgi:hypothetical protein